MSVPLSWTAVDPEEGPVPFAQTRVLVAKADVLDIGSQPLFWIDYTAQVVVSQLCTDFQPPFGCVGEWVTTYSLDVAPLPGENLTTARIRIIAEDSTGLSGEDFSDIIITQLF